MTTKEITTLEEEVIELAIKLANDLDPFGKEEKQDSMDYDKLMKGSFSSLSSGVETLCLF